MVGSIVSRSSYHILNHNNNQILLFFSFFSFPVCRTREGAVGNVSFRLAEATAPAKKKKRKPKTQLDDAVLRFLEKKEKKTT
jgi:hypothetical protein